MRVGKGLEFRFQGLRAWDSGFRVWAFGNKLYCGFSYHLCVPALCQIRNKP